MSQTVERPVHCPRIRICPVQRIRFCANGFWEEGSTWFAAEKMYCPQLFRNNPPVAVLLNPSKSLKRLEHPLAKGLKSGYTCAQVVLHTRRRRRGTARKRGRDIGMRESLTPIVGLFVIPVSKVEDRDWKHPAWREGLKSGRLANFLQRGSLPERTDGQPQGKRRISIHPRAVTSTLAGSEASVNRSGWFVNPAPRRGQKGSGGPNCPHRDIAPSEFSRRYVKRQLMLGQKESSLGDLNPPKTLTSTLDPLRASVNRLGVQPAPRRESDGGSRAGPRIVLLGILHLLSLQEIGQRPLMLGTEGNRDRNSYTYVAALFVIPVSKSGKEEIGSTGLAEEGLKSGTTAEQWSYYSPEEEPIGQPHGKKNEGDLNQHAKGRERALLTIRGIRYRSGGQKCADERQTGRRQGPNCPPFLGYALRVSKEICQAPTDVGTEGIEPRFALSDTMSLSAASLGIITPYCAALFVIPVSKSLKKMKKRLEAPRIGEKGTEVWDTTAEKVVLHNRQRKKPMGALPAKRVEISPGRGLPGIDVTRQISQNPFTASFRTSSLT
ncbi:hypothetical protein HNY73_021562 [Argiope bruennichi]|uniref:Uncharacterized protein n=1 Tax=Argiope bruennichi TaxID=94029 RepID=A0A8T0E259_ARGBR|nr:hypothetical protein HNY73_021562 [Argiope bruennichi]